MLAHNVAIETTQYASESIPSLIWMFPDISSVQTGAELAFAFPLLSVTVLGSTALYVTTAQKNVQKAEELADQHRKDIEEAEAARLRLVHEMQVLQDKETKLVSRLHRLFRVSVREFRLTQGRKPSSRSLGKHSIVSSNFHQTSLGC